MQGYLPSVIAISIFAKLIKFTLPKDSSISKYTSMFLGICITAIMVSPVVQVLSSISEVNFSINNTSPAEEEYSEIFGEYIAEKLYPSVEEYIYKTLNERYSITKENAEIFIRFETKGDVIAIRQIIIFLKGKAVFADTGVISDYFEEKFLCRIDVSVDIP